MSMFQTEVKEDVSVVGLALSSRKNLCIHPEVCTAHQCFADPGSAAFLTPGSGIEKIQFWDSE